MLFSVRITVVEFEEAFAILQFCIRALLSSLDLMSSVRHYEYDEKGNNVHTYTYIHTYINTYIHTYIHKCMHTCIQTNINVYIHSHICIRKYMHINIHVHIHTILYLAGFSKRLSTVTSPVSRVPPSPHLPNFPVPSS